MVVNAKQEEGEKKELSETDIVCRILQIVERETAGSPTDKDIKWTHLSFKEIAEEYESKWAISISGRTVKRILRTQGYRKRRPSKSLMTGKSPFRAEQFALIFYFSNLFSKMKNNAILSVDTKKKEFLGNLDRGGKVLSNKAPIVFDHDYPHLAEGKVVPHGIYDVKQNMGYVTIGTNKETAEFIGDNLIWWWENYGIHLYPDASHILLFCDSGGANGYRHHAFKKKMLEVARHIGVRIVIVHYPPYCSKWNPIEHRLFSQMHHAADGVIFTSYEQVKSIFEKTKTKTGLSVSVRISRTQYQTGLKIRASDVEEDRVLKHPLLPQFNYTLLP